MKPRISAALLGALLVVAAPVSSEEGPAWADFSFKRIGVPQAGVGKRITVQIDPEAQAAFIASRPKPGDRPQRDDDVATLPPLPGGGTGSFPWFWTAVSPALAEASASRLETAISHLTDGLAGATVPAPRLQAMQEIADAHGADILKATIGTRVSPALVLAVIGIESSGRSTAVSPKGASGLMQLMPATAERFGVTDTTVPAENIRGGVAYLHWLMGEFDNDPMLVLAGYNAGEGAVRTHGGVPPYNETRDYVPKVLAAWQVAKGLCVTPPELLSDGCVFMSRRAGP